MQELPAHVAKKLDALTGCVAAAVRVDHVEAVLRACGFGDVEVQVKPESRTFIMAAGLRRRGVRRVGHHRGGEAKKAKRDCCGPSCCAGEART